MKKNIGLILFCLLLSNIYSQQSSWKWQYPVPQGNSLYSVYFINQMIGWTAGDNGTILKTTDGGFSWNFQDCKASIFFKSIFFVNQNIGWAVGQDSLKSGIVLKTTNGGSDWVEQLKRTTSISSIYFFDENNGWIVCVDSAGNAPIFKTSNGGESWNQLFTAQLINKPVSIRFVDENNGWLCGNRYYWITMEGPAYEGFLYRTKDGGKTWDLKFDDNTPIVSMNLIDENHCTAVKEDRTTLNTTDGGTTWTSYQNKIDMGLYSAYSIDDKNGCAFNIDGYYKTTDGGKSWIEHEKSNAVISIYFINNRIGWAVGYFGSIMKTTDGGDTWIDGPKMIKGAIQSMYFLDKNIGWAVGGDYYKNYSGIILSTTDGGKNWLNSNFLTDCWIQSIRFIDKNIGWMCGYNQYGYGVVLKTVDGGQSWLNQQIGTAGALNSIFCINENLCIAVGSTGTLLTTTDGGITWNKGFSNSYNSVFFVDANNGWLVGNNGIIAKYEFDNGTRLKTSGTTKDLFSVFFIDKNIGWVVGYWGTILKTTDGGQTWFNQNSGIIEPLRSVYFIDINNGWIVGDYGNIFNTTDGGNNWILQEKVTNNSLNSVWFFDNKIGWIGGEAGTILHTTNGGITSVKESFICELPNGFNLFQNYPNPFNPTTTINYSIPKQAFVLLTVYDMLGREAAILVNEEKPAGNYSIKFNCRNLSSGVYLYRIQAGSFVETKKLTLLK
jgi:photosystem II stability/assembly factor-like uncharacterized protein